AKLWRKENAKMIHVVDFDGAWEHSNKNFKVVEEMCSSIVIPVQFTGGIRNIDDVKNIMNCGIIRLAINTMAIENRKDLIKALDIYGPKKIVIALDILDDELVIKGRKIKTGIHYLQFAKEMLELGIERFLVTDISKNGMMEGPNLSLSKEIAEQTNVKITHSGGIRNKDELMDFQNLCSIGVDSVIIGRAFYENRFPCQKLWRVAESGTIQ
ncbi:MAG: 1-(5-phosphoribosyl)-5-[(5-phosphoribosylamino)methylideneamino] imidazole-4-carboxamide isomerase, partial [Bacteroidetes bacterium]|nr:1-(5-phosphoribosyl)-5-[(5-phosphoribosylamino)methylideneamino] imidazole-4-carboxamide isomerase [Bacteroidota bacterium]